MNKAVKNVEYFQGRSEGFDRLFSSFLKKYKRYGVEANGTVLVKNPSELEKEYISSFTGKDYRRSKSISLSFRKFEAILKEREFEVVDIKTLLEQYYKQTQLTTKEKIHKERIQYDDFLEKVKALSEHLYFKWYVESVEMRSSGYRRFNKLYKESPMKLLKNLQLIAAAVAILPLKRSIRLPYFSTKIIGNPHTFDTNKELGKLLIEVLHIAFLKEDKKVFQYETKAEQVQELLLFVGILKDDITNYVGFTGLGIYDDTGVESNLYKESYNIGKVNLEPLREVIKFASVKSYWEENYVFIVEGSGIFSTIVDEVFEKVGKVPPLICTLGQFRVAAIKLVDLLVKNGYTVLYSGDHDPKGVLMAQQLCNRFGESVIPWGYKEEYYKNTSSKESIENTYMPLLNSIDHKGLMEIKKLLQCTRIACYQEDFTSKLVDDIVDFKW